MKLIDKDALVVVIERRISQLESEYKKLSNLEIWITAKEIKHKINGLKEALSIINTLEVKEVNVSNISENLAEAHEYLDYTSTGNLAHNKPMVCARLKKAILGLFDAGLFELTHDKKYRMEHLGLKTQKGKYVQ